MRASCLAALKLRSMFGPADDVEDDVGAAEALAHDLDEVLLS